MSCRAVNRGWRVVRVIGIGDIMKQALLIITILGTFALSTAWVIAHDTHKTPHDTCWLRGDYLFLAADASCDVVNGKLANCSGARVECHLDEEDENE